MPKTKERVSEIEGNIRHLATKSALKSLEVRMTRTMYVFGIGLVITVFGVVANILISILR